MRIPGFAAVTLAVALCSCPAWGQGAVIGEASKEAKAQARTPYLEAKKSFDAGDYAPALEGFRASYQIVASPNSHLMIAKALEGLGRVAEAYREAKAAVPEAEAAAQVEEKYGRTADDARGVMERLRGQVGYLTVRLPVGQTGTVTVGDAPIGDLSEPTLVDPGEVSVRFDGPNGAEERSITLGAGGTGLIDFGAAEPGSVPPPDDITPDKPFELGPVRVTGIALAGVGVVGMVLFGVFGSKSSSSFSNLEDACTPDGACPAEAQADIDDGKTFQTVANVGLVVGVTGLIAGTALFLLEPEILGEEESSASLRLTVGPGALGVKGTF
jgi:hypothetical protein